MCLCLTTWLALASDPLLLPGTQIWDKLNHFIAFFVLALLTDNAFPGSKPDWIKWIALLAYGFMLETAQWATGYRYFEFNDLLADSIGIVAFLPVQSLVRRMVSALPARSP